MIDKKREGYGVRPGLLTTDGQTNSRVESEEYLLQMKFPMLDMQIPEMPLLSSWTLEEEDSEAM